MRQTSFSTDAYLRLRLGTPKQNKSRGEINMETLLAAKEWNKVFYQGGQKYRIQVRGQLEIVGGNNFPYFSIGGDIYRLAKNGRKVWECGGCIHEEIVKHFPQLQLLVDIHLADDEGVPMHAYANAAYWAGHTKYQKFDSFKLAKHLRISPKLADDMVDYIANFWGEFDDISTPSMAWEATCSDYSLPEQWKQQAQAAKLLLSHQEKESA
jgi:hypothetical protein